METICWICGKEITAPISEKDQELLDSEDYTMDDIEREYFLLQNIVAIAKNAGQKKRPKTWKTFGSKES